MYVFKLVNRTLFIDALYKLGEPSDIQRETGINHNTVSNWLRRDKNTTPNSDNLETIFTTCKKLKIKIEVNKKEKIVDIPEDIGLKKEEKKDCILQKNLEYLLAYNNLTQKQLAEKTGISAVQITRIKNNEEQKIIEHLKTIADALNVPLDILVKGNDSTLFNNKNNYPNFNFNLNTIKKLNKWSDTANKNKFEIEHGGIDEMEVFNSIICDSDVIEQLTQYLNQLVGLNVQSYYGIDNDMYEVKFEEIMINLKRSMELFINWKADQIIPTNDKFPKGEHIY